MRRSVVFAIPGDIDQATGGYGYDRWIAAELETAGWDVAVLGLSASFPEPTPDAVAEAAAAFAALPADQLVLVDGLAFGAMGAIAEREAARLRLVALVHHPLTLETGLEPDRARALRAEERRALACARRVICTSKTTAGLLAREFGVPAERLAVALPGTEPGPLAQGAGEPPVIVAVGSLTERKGQDVLVAALALLSDRAWHCRIVGSTERDGRFAAKVREAVARAGLAERIVITGEVADVRSEMAKADIFALATRFEGYGMVFAEAMSQGLPVVGCAVGAVPEVVPEDAGTLVAPDDPEAFAAALRALLEDRPLRDRKAAGARTAAGRFPDWAASAAIVSRALSEAMS